MTRSQGISPGIRPELLADCARTKKKRRRDVGATRADGLLLVENTREGFPFVDALR